MVLLGVIPGLPAAPALPLRLAIVGLGHGDGFFAEALARRDVQGVGVVEPKPSLATQSAECFHLRSALLSANLEQMLADAKPEGVAVFAR